MTFAVTADAVLDGESLAAVPASSWVVRTRELRHVRESATGARREVLLATAAGQALVRRVRSFTITWTSVGAMRDLAEELLAAPGEHTLVLWRHEYLTFRGDGATVEFTLPNGWLLAGDVLAGALPPAVTAAELEPRVKVGREGDELTYSLQDVATYDAGDPGAGEVWFAEGESRFKLAAAPALGATLHARLVPVYRVLQAPERPETRLDGPIREPLEVTLLEVG